MRLGKKHVSKFRLLKFCEHKIQGQTRDSQMVIPLTTNQDLHHSPKAKCFQHIKEDFTKAMKLNGRKYFT
jgi:hypothetical protein